MRLILVRHGQTECNTRDIWHGWDACELTGEGLQQARAVANRLAREKLDVIYSSDSRRALQTAQAVAAPHKLIPVTDPRLRERNAGEYEGLATKEVLTRYPRIWEERAADFWGWSPPSGETYHDVLRRSLNVVERLTAQYPNGTLAIVTHMGPLRVLISHLARIPLEETYQKEIPSTCVTIFSLDGEKVRVESLYDATHVG